MTKRTPSNAKLAILNRIGEQGEEARQRLDRKHEIEDFLATAEIHTPRRVLFTTLAVLTFVVLTWETYWVSHGVSLDGYSTPPGRIRAATWVAYLFGNYLWVPVAASVAILPTMLLSLSAWNSLFKVFDPLLLVSSFMFAATTVIGFWLGHRDVMSLTAWATRFPDGGLPSPSEWGRVVIQARAEHTVSWLSLSVPVLLTTAFVIYGAWRRAVRDAEAATGEDDV